MTNETGRSYLAIAGLAVLILVPSFDTTAKYFGIVGTGVYFGAGFVAIVLCVKLGLPASLERLTDKTAIVIAAAALVFLLIFVTVMYPLANSGRFGPGSDVDDAMIMAGYALAHGEYPYYLKTYLGFPISPMPGAILLGLPFVLLNLLPYQNIFWMGILFYFSRQILKNTGLALGIVLTPLILNLTTWQGLATGSDYISNSIYVIIALWLLIRSIPDPEFAEWKKVLLAIFLGVGLSSRSNFLLIMPLFFSAIVQSAGWKEAFKYSAIAVSVFVATTLPFWIYDQKGFSPLVSQAAKMNALEPVLPFAGIIIPTSAICLALALSFQRMGRDGSVFFVSSAIVQLFVLLFMSTLYSIASGTLDIFMGTAGYGIFALYFATLGGWTAVSAKSSNTNVHPIAEF